jgi:hypothetical protein
MGGLGESKGAIPNMIGPEFPRLTTTKFLVTSPATTDYNCIAWAASDMAHWWQPGSYWPVEVDTGEYGIGVLEAAFVALGFVPCESGLPEPGIEKVALYAESGLLYTHAARQLDSGKWTSKLGGGETSNTTTPMT